MLDNIAQFKNRQKKAACSGIKGHPFRGMNQTIVNCASFASLIILVTKATAGAQLEIALLWRTIPSKGHPSLSFSLLPP